MKCRSFGRRMVFDEKSGHKSSTRSGLTIDQLEESLRRDAREYVPPPTNLPQSISAEEIRRASLRRLSPSPADDPGFVIGARESDQAQWNDLKKINERNRSFYA